jgi:1-deoxy-D-xylulose-5-phosphate reductoisomerase
MKNKVAILGSTGSIGVNALDVLRNLRDKFDVTALSTNRNIPLLARQIKEYKPEFVCVTEEKDAMELRKKFNLKVFSGNEGLREISGLSCVDTVLVSVVGSAALYPLISAIKSKKRVALANKEALVIAGSLVMDLVKKHKTCRQRTLGDISVPEKRR